MSNNNQKPHNPNKQSTEDILKRIENQSPQLKRQKARDILLNKIPQQPNSKKTYTGFATPLNWNNYRQKFSQHYQYFVRQVRNPLHQKTVMMTCFLIFSTYIAFRIEQKYDKLRNVATKTKTYKAMHIQKQNQYISKYLNKEQFVSVPIQQKQQEQFNPSYKYEEDKNMVMDTREYLLEAIAKQYKQGLKIDSQMETQLRNKGMI